LINPATSLAISVYKFIELIYKPETWKPSVDRIYRTDVP
jgi:hypothetical protein